MEKKEVSLNWKKTCISNYLKTKKRKKKSEWLLLKRNRNTAVLIFEENCCHLEGLLLVIKIQENTGLYFLHSTVKEKINKSRRKWEKSKCLFFDRKEPLATLWIVILVIIPTPQLQALLASICYGVLSTMITVTHVISIFYPIIFWVHIMNCYFKKWSWCLSYCQLSTLEHQLDGTEKRIYLSIHNS